jgi:hypothetical protein
MDLNAAIAPRPLLSTIEHFSPAYNFGHGRCPGAVSPQ